MAGLSPQPCCWGHLSQLQAEFCHLDRIAALGRVCTGDGRNSLPLCFITGLTFTHFMLSSLIRLALSFLFSATNIGWKPPWTFVKLLNTCCALLDPYHHLGYREKEGSRTGIHTWLLSHGSYSVGGGQLHTGARTCWANREQSACCSPPDSQLSPSGQAQAPSAPTRAL